MIQYITTTTLNRSYHLKMRWFPIPEERQSREVSDVVSLRSLLVAHSETQICVASNYQLMQRSNICAHAV